MQKEAIMQVGILIYFVLIYNKFSMSDPISFILDSIQWYIKYLQIRNNDYKIWKEMGHTFLYCYYHFAQPKLDFITNIMKTIAQEILHNTLATQLALICVNRAYKLMLTTPWATSISYINSRFTREKQEIEELLSYLEK